MEEIGRVFAERLNRATGPIAIAIPTAGLSIPNFPDGVFWDPAADRAFVESLRADIRPDITIHTYAQHVNDPSFGEIVADLFVELMEDAALSAAQLERTK
jgi:uncharacterized protein (UPF0261 family)